MATIKRFEDIVSWQKARELNQILGVLIDGGKFKHSYKLIDQIESSCGSDMDNIAEGFNVAEIVNFSSFCISPKALAASLDLSFIEHLIENILHRMSLMICIKEQWK